MTKALVVEDDPLNMELVFEMLGAKGFTAEGAMTGEDAINMAEKEVYDLVLTDIGLPGIDGIEVAKIIKSKPGYETIPVIAFTAYATMEDKNRFLSGGFDDYIPKPVDVIGFMKKMEKYKK